MSPHLVDQMENQEVNQLVEHFFRYESGKMVAVLTKIFGTENLDLAEDVVQDAIIEAISHWQYNGIPKSPSAWLFRVAKNKAINIVNREKYFHRYSSETAHLLKSELKGEAGQDDVLTEQEIQDDLLRMIFICCHPVNTPDSQIALALRTLCGFSVSEIAKAFLTTEDNIKKRLVRSRQKIRDANIPFEVPTGNDLERRLQSVMETIYLLFNEGYSASRGNDIVRFELCEEAIRLVKMITSHPGISDKSNGYALQALMQLNASRFKSRQDAEGNILTLEKQDRRLWDFTLIENGFSSLERSVNADHISNFHILATISAYHCSAVNYEATDWRAILALYDSLLKIDSSPVVLLNRAIALARVSGASAAIEELKNLEGSSSLKSYHHYYSTLGALYIESNRYKEAIPILQKAIDLASLPAEKVLLQKKIDLCHEK